MNLHVGTSGFSYKEWRGSFYPKDLPVDQMLRHYAARFGTVEINNTFYGMPKPAPLKAWAAQVPTNFRFVLKATGQLTHAKRLKDAGAVVANMLKIFDVMGRRLGPILFQLPPNFKQDVPRLDAFLALFPARRRVAFEFRHASWFDDEVFDALRDHNAAMCVAEVDEDLDVPFISTADFGYIRLRRAEYSDAQLKTWIKLIRRQKWRDAFVFFKHEDEGKGPRFAGRFLELAGASLLTSAAPGARPA